MIVLDRLDALRKKHEHVLDKLVMDILRVLNTSDMDVKRKALGIALEMVSSRNAEEVVLFLKKELVKTLDATYEKVRFEFSGELRRFGGTKRRSGSDLAEPRIQTTPHPEHPQLRHQILRGRFECRPRPHGVPRRFKQYICCRRHCLCQVSAFPQIACPPRATPLIRTIDLESQGGRREVSGSPFGDHREVVADLPRDQVWKGLQGCALDRWGVLCQC